jgi:hypothetical protein
LPADDFPTFRAAMRATLTAAQFAAADRLYLTTVTEALDRLAAPLSGQGTQSSDQPGRGRPVLDRTRLEDAVAAYLHTLIGRSGSRAELTVRIRAAQTAAFHLGWLLQVKLDRLVATTATPSAAAVADPDTWDTLRLYREPHSGAVLVLAALGCDAETIRTLPAAAVSADGATVTVHGVPLPTPPGAAVLLRAQLTAGQLEGRGADAPFVHAHGEEFPGGKVLATVRRAYLDTGIPLLSRIVGHTWSDAEWLSRWGVCLQDLA